MNSFILFVNDGSGDSTWSIISDLHAINNKVKGVNLSGNVGHQNALHAGLMTAKDISDITISIDADLQDDLSVIEEKLLKYNQGNDIVYGVKAIYNHADFRLMSKRALLKLAEYKEANLYLRGIIPQMGFPSDTVADVISERKKGVSKYTLVKMLNLAIDGITSFSIKPVRLIFFMGLIFLLLTFFYAIYAIFEHFAGETIPGWTSLILSVWFIGALILMSIGIVGEYIGKIYMETKARPKYTIEKILL